MKAEPAFHGDWRITETEVWARDALDLVQPAFIKFEDEGMGEFAMIAIRGALHCYFGERDGKPLVEFSWEGEDEGDARCGRGWGTIDTDGVMRGRFFIHRGDDSGFVAERAKAGATTARRRRKQ